MAKDKIPNRRSMEKRSLYISRLFENKTFESEEELNYDMNAGELAQDIVYDAWEIESRKERVKMAKKALSISPDCADAYNLLAEDEAETFEEAIELYRKGIDGGKRTLGKECFKESKGHFWGYVPTRPYMRSLAGLMECLWEIGEHDEAIKYAKEMLRLNVSDNQGIRYILLSYLIKMERYSELDILLNNKRYRNDCGIDWLYARALFTFAKEGDSEAARKELKVALNSNKFFPEYITGKKTMPRFLPDYVVAGGEDEAFCSASRFLPAWKQVPGAIEWLKEQVEI